MKKQNYIPLIVAISLIVGITIGYFFVNKGSSSKSFNKNDKLSYIFSLIEEEYVDKVNGDSLTDQAIRSFLKDLDPHSVYLTADEVKSENESLQGNFDGIGVQFRIVKDTIVVIQPVKGGPSEKVGIMAGDRIVKINGVKRVKNVTNDTVLHYLKGVKGSKVKLSIYRQGVNHLIDFTVTRDVIKTKSVSYYGMLDNTTGYIKLTQFSATSHQEVANALKALNKQGMKKLVFDLRDNGGGYLDQAIAIADEFLVKNDLIVYTNGRYRGRNDAYAEDGGLFEKGKLIVLINELSASASEIVSGAIQDNDRGVIIGRRTFGKGLVQEQKELPDHSAIRLTVARYYTPSGRCIQRPYIKGDPDKYFEDFVARFNNMEKHKDTISHNPSLKYKTKKGRIVYGGGGIEPDFEEPYYEYKKGIYYTNLLKKGLIYKYCFDYVDKNRRALSKYNTGDKFVAQYYVDNKFYNGLIAYASKNGVKKGVVSSKDENEIKLLMKAYIAQGLYDDKYFYQIYLRIDQDLQKAIKHF
ncbi:MAG: S41 family peptidase [Bacteroidales bacterium]|jgi:carboxyl-terminal processing protease|nr:S41 family peptidase [Bacteroidales bacterium]